ncbi:MAG TPA: hypothetical protein VJB57_21690 [Dehalococcoidia bacterium]|nr:hypothetical protein [Dehalococcoidia bacterium]
MNITINSNQTRNARTLGFALRVSAVVGLAAIGLTLTGVIGGRDADRTHAQPSAAGIGRAVPEVQHVYYVVDSQQAATNALIAESVTAQERLLAGVVAPERVVHIIDDSDAGRMTAAEAMLLAQ